MQNVGRISSGFETKLKFYLLLSIKHEILEQMVEEKSKDLIAIQENLEATNRRQALFIKVLQIL